MTKKILFTIFMCFVFIMIIAQTPGNGTSIELTTEYVGYGSQSPSGPKTHIVPPEVSINGHYLYFTGNQTEFVLTLTDEDENVVYVTDVYATDTQIVLPVSFSGAFKLRLYTDIYCFVGEITLI